jgi:hypothetical protein
MGRKPRPLPTEPRSCIAGDLCLATPYLQPIEEFIGAERKITQHCRTCRAKGNLPNWGRPRNKLVVKEYVHDIGFYRWMGQLIQESREITEEYGRVEL